MGCTGRGEPLRCHALASRKLRGRGNVLPDWSAIPRFASIEYLDPSCLDSQSGDLGADPLERPMLWLSNCFAGHSLRHPAQKNRIAAAITAALSVVRVSQRKSWGVAIISLENECPCVRLWKALEVGAKFEPSDKHKDKQQEHGLDGGFHGRVKVCRKNFPVSRS